MNLQFPLILDGATGTELQKHGYTGSICAERWILEHPDAIRSIQRAYVQSGTQLIYAPTFGANRYKLEENGLVDCVIDYNSRLAALTKETVGEQILVGGDIAPTGKFMAPMGDARFDDLVTVYHEQAGALADAGVDMFAIETLMTLSDARAAVLAIRSVSDKPIFVTFTCNAKGKTLVGTDVAAALVIMEGMGVHAFGLNCSVGPEDMITQIERLSAITHIPLIAKPNAGIPHVVDGKAVYDAKPEDFRPYVRRFAELGVAAFGGCCGTDPEFIRIIADELSQTTIRIPDNASELMPLATEKELFLLPADAAYGEVIDCSDSLDEDLEEDEEADTPLVALRISDEDQLQSFMDFTYAIHKPLCLLCEDLLLLEQALRAYQGRALYEGALSPEVLAPLCDRYGLIIR